MVYILTLLYVWVMLWLVCKFKIQWSLIWLVCKFRIQWSLIWLVCKSRIQWSLNQSDLNINLSNVEMWKCLTWRWTSWIPFCVLFKLTLSLFIFHEPGLLVQCFRRRSHNLFVRETIGNPRPVVTKWWHTCHELRFCKPENLKLTENTD